MKVLNGTSVDVIEPFPDSQYSRLWRWTKMTKMITALDGSPQSEPDFIEFMKRTAPFCRTFGVIDKNGELGLRHEAPLVGFIMFEPMPPCSLYAHIVSSRRAWGTGLMEEAARMTINEVFATEPGALRVSAAIPAFNKAAIAFAKKVGMHKDGFFLKAATIKGKPVNIMHFGIIRDEEKEDNGVGTSRDSKALGGQRSGGPVRKSEDKPDTEH